LLETAVHRHAKHIRMYRRLKIESLNERTIDTVKRYVGRLRKFTIDISTILSSISEDVILSMDQDSLSRLDLLTFYIYEVAVNEEEEVLKALLMLQNELGIEIVSYKDLEHVRIVRDLAKKINVSIQPLLK